jgi:hypothetical protein
VSGCAGRRALILPSLRRHPTAPRRHDPQAMRPFLPIAAAVLLGACASMDTHRSACSERLGLAAALPVKDSAETEPDPAVEACATQRRAQEEQAVGQGIALGVGAAALVAVGALLGAASSPRAYRSRSYDRRAYRRGW